MITRIKINGFKSLLNCELYFGPFTCIAGANAIGKSNFFDAISFLSNLADKTIIEAAKSVRSENFKHSDIKDIFYRCGSKQITRMSFEIDMLISENGIDDLGQEAKATLTSLRYSLHLKWNDESLDKEPIEIEKEELIPLTQTDTKKNIHFDYTPGWIDSVMKGRRAGSPFISTAEGLVKLHSDSSEKKRGGRTTQFIAEKMPRTLLSTTTFESPTAFLVRQEMRDWTNLQFEPSALREPNHSFQVKNAKISANGKNVPATLFRLQSEKKDKDIYQNLTNTLKDLVDEVDEILVDKDDKRDLLTLQVRFKGGLILPAQSLSDGTLRFLGLSIIQENSSGNNIICLEEPENGINPKKIKEIVDLLNRMATDIHFAVDDDNPLRQVIINTHSPLVVRSVPDESLYLAKTKEQYLDDFGKKVSFTCFSALHDTWKTNGKIRLFEETTLGEISSYLGGFDNSSDVGSAVSDARTSYATKSKSIQRRTVAENVRQYTLNL